MNNFHLYFFDFNKYINFLFNKLQLIHISQQLIHISQKLIHISHHTI